MLFGVSDEKGSGVMGLRDDDKLLWDMLNVCGWLDSTLMLPLLSVKFVSWARSEWGKSVADNVDGDVTADVDIVCDVIWELELAVEGSGNKKEQENQLRD